MEKVEPCVRCKNPFVFDANNAQDPDDRFKLGYYHMLLNENKICRCCYNKCLEVFD